MRSMTVRVEAWVPDKGKVTIANNSYIDDDVKYGMLFIDTIMGDDYVNFQNNYRDMEGQFTFMWDLKFTPGDVAESVELIVHCSKISMEA